MPFDLYDLTQPDWCTASEWIDIGINEAHNRKFGCRFATYHKLRPTEFCTCSVGECSAASALSVNNRAAPKH